MKDYFSKDVRNVVMLGHSGSGKTSVIESMLYYTKATERFGKTTEGSSVLDFDAEEIKRGMTIYTTIAPVEWNDKKINFLDTPGYLDFEAETQAALVTADNALIVVSAKDQVQSGTIRAFKEVSKIKLPTIFFINKIDEENSSFEKTYEDLRNNFGKTVIPFEVPILEKGNVVGSVNILKKKSWYYADLTTPKEVPADMVDVVDEYYSQICESVAMGDDELMEKFFSGEEFDDHELAKGLRIGVRSGEIRPIFCGSATNMTGITRLLDLICEYFPSYAEKGTVTAYDEEGLPVELHTSEEEITTAFVFKTIVDPFVGKINYLKVTSGVLSTDQQIYNVNKDKMEKINQIFSIRGKHQLAVGKLFTGDIGAIVKLQYTATNDTLTVKGKNIRFNPIEFVQPMLCIAVWPKTKNDEDKLSGGLQKLTEEDMACIVINHPETKETLLYGVGDQHIDVLLNKLKSKYKVEVTTSKPKVPYHETIRATAIGEGRHKKQSGGAGQFGHVFVRFEPCDSEEMIFDEEVFGGAVPRQFFPAVEVGLRECMNKGLLAGYKMVNVKAVLYDGKYHEVDSKEIAFKSAARLAFKDGIPKAKPVLLEPIWKVSVICPEAYTGTVVGDFNKRRGLIMGMDAIEDEQIITAEVPMAEMMTYATELRSFTQGRAKYMTEFVRYDVVPQQIAEVIIKNAVREQEEE
ncbi:MAG: elongation factor G [Erysipelotrichaceae bacterium]